MSVDVIEDGSLGFFWPVTSRRPNIEGEPERGYVKRHGRWAHIEVLEEDAEAAWLRTDDEPPPSAVAAVLPEDAALFLEVRGRYGTTRSGLRASSGSYDARTVIGGLDVTRLRSYKPLSLRPHFHGLESWAGLTAVEETTEFHPDNRVRAMTIALRGAPDLQAALPGHRTLTLSATWKVGGPRDKRRIEAPLAIGCEARSPRRTWDLLQPLLLVQDLVNFAHGGFIGAVPGTAQLHVDVDPGDLPQTPWMWNGALMVMPPGAIPRTDNMWPMFDLADIGGIEGLARWVRLAANNPRAVLPITQWYRSGGQSPPSALRETAAAIEYWMRKTTRGTAARPLDRLIKRVGRPFQNWVTDSDAWSDRFWQTYNRLKHEPTFDSDDLELSDLAASGRYLLAAALLGRTARSTEPAKKIFADYRVQRVGRRLQHIL